MHLTILYDNQSIDEKFQSGWGFSCLVGDDILFDTGEAPEPLFRNMRYLGVRPADVRAVVISHNHWDHTGGLWELLKRNPGLDVYACPGFGLEFRDKVVTFNGRLIESVSFRKIFSTGAVTGEIPARYKGAPMPEQALIVESARGLAVVTGCSHPGIVRIVEAVKREFPARPITHVLGGFHLMDKSVREIRSVVGRMHALGVQSVGPTHCTGNQAKRIFQETYGDQVLPVAAGARLELT